MSPDTEESEVLNFERHIEDQKPAIKAGEMLARLNKNKDFQELVVEGYFRQEAIRLVHAISIPTKEIQSPEVQEDMQRDIRAIGSFANYLQLIADSGERAKNTVLQTEEMLEEMRNEADGIEI